jgi:hypothetical protein
MAMAKLKLNFAIVFKNYFYKSFSPSHANMFIGVLEKGSIEKIIGKWNYHR